MKTPRQIILILFLFCSLFEIACDPSNTDPYIYDGVSYNRTTGLNETKTALYDSRDNTVYPVVSLNSKFWMAENLRYNTNNDSWLNSNNPTASYGRLYNWSKANTACPKGWHLPSDTEWQNLEIFMGMDALDAKTIGWRAIPPTQIESIKSTQGWTVTGNGSNSSGFNIFPAGRYDGGNFIGLGEYAYFWTSTLVDPNNSLARYFYRNFTDINRDNISNATAHSCRCVLD